MIRGKRNFLLTIFLMALLGVFLCGQAALAADFTNEPCDGCDGAAVTVDADAGTGLPGESHEDNAAQTRAADMNFTGYWYANFSGGKVRLQVTVENSGDSTGSGYYIKLGVSKNQQSCGGTITTTKLATWDLPSISAGNSYSVDQEKSYDSPSEGDYYGYLLLMNSNDNYVDCTVSETTVHFTGDSGDDSGSSSGCFIKEVLQ